MAGGVLVAAGRRAPGVRASLRCAITSIDRSGTRTTTINGYYNQAVRNTEVRRAYRFRHEGVQKIGYISPMGQGTYLFTSATLSGQRIYTHCVTTRAYLSNLGTKLRGQ